MSEANKKIKLKTFIEYIIYSDRIITHELSYLIA